MKADTIFNKPSRSQIFQVLHIWLPYQGFAPGTWSLQSLILPRASCVPRVTCAPSAIPTSETGYFVISPLLRAVLGWLDCGVSVRRGFWRDALFWDCEHKRTGGQGLSHVEWFGGGVGCFAAFGVCMSGVQVKKLQGAVVVGLILGGGRQRHYYSWQYIIFENNDWHLCWKGFDLQYSLPLAEPWWQWRGVSIMIIEERSLKVPCCCDNWSVKVKKK